MSKKLILACSSCGSRNYSSPAKDKPSDRMEVKKYCRYCNAHTVHKQTV